MLGAAAFIIAEFLKISYLDVILMATIPTCLFYLALFLMVEIDVRKFGMQDVRFEQRRERLERSRRRYWFHFLSLVSIVVFMLMRLLAGELSVFWATVVAFVTSFLRRDTALIPTTCLTGSRSGAACRVRLHQGAGGRLDVGAERRRDLRRRRASSSAW